jgi:S1-C subfamily serine protease
VLLSGVRVGGPAEQAGVRRGDVLVRIGTHDIRTVEDFEFALRSAHPGDRVTVVVERDGQRLELPATLGKRTR